MTIEAWLTSTISVLAGVIVGAVATYLVSRRLSRLEHRRMHRAAVRAVLYELSANMIVAGHPTITGQGSTTAYDSLAGDFYADLPDDVSAAVSEAYGMIHSVGLTARSLSYAKNGIEQGQAVLRAYAVTALKLNFVPPESASHSFEDMS